MAEIDRDKVRKDFDEAVNMTASELKKWLHTKESRAVGWKGKDGKAQGRKCRPCQRPPDRWYPRQANAELSDDDYSHMRKVIGYVRRHRAQEPANRRHVPLAISAS